MNFRAIFIGGLFLILLISSPYIYSQEPVKENEQLDFAQGLMSRGMYDMAILQYQKFISDYPHSASLPEAYLCLGESYFLSREFIKASDTFNQLIGRFPHCDQTPVALLRLGQIDIRQKKYDEALKELTSIDVQKQIKGGMLQSFDLYTAQAYMGKSDTASALDYFQKAAQVGGTGAYTFYAFEKIAQIQTQNGHYSEAIDAYARSMQLTQQGRLKGALIYRIAELQFLSGRYEDASKSFRQVIEQYPGLGFTQDALANLLLAYFNLGQYDRLLSEYQKNAKVIKEEDTYFAIHFSAVLADIELKKYDQANALMDRILAFPALKSQERARIFIKKADILIRAKKFKDGLALLEAYSPEDPDHADENFFLKAQCYYGLGDFDRAYNFFGNVYLNFPGSRFFKAAILGQAYARKAMGRYKEAEGLFLKYYDLQDDPDLKSETLLMLVECYDKNNQPQDAINVLQGYLDGPKTVGQPNAAYFLLGFNLQLLGRSDEALAAYAQVDQHKQDGKFYISALKNMAIIYLRQKKQDQAMAYFDRLISQADTNDLQLKTYIWICNEYLKEQKYNDVLRIAARAEKRFAGGQDLLEIKYFKAEALRGSGNCDDAVKNYDLVISSAQKNAYTGSAHIGYGLCLAKDGKFNAATIEFQKSLDENADDYTITMHARFEMANTEASQGDLQGAFKLYFLIATIYNDDYYCPESLLRGAEIAERLARRSDALKMYSEILDKYKNSTEALVARGRVSLLK